MNQLVPIGSGLYYLMQHREILSPNKLIGSNSKKVKLFLFATRMVSFYTWYGYNPEYNLQLKEPPSP